MRLPTTHSILLFLLSNSALAQLNLPKLGDTTSTGATNAPTTNTAAATTTTNSGLNTVTATNTDSQATTTGTNSQITSTGTLPKLGTTTTTTSAQASDLPKLTTTSYDGIAAPPRLSGFFSYPAPSVPPTANAPYMQHSSLPDGTVFIIAGAVLGFCFFLFLLWRGLVILSLRRSMKRAKNLYGEPKGAGERKSMLPPFYQDNAHRASVIPLDPLTSSGKKKGASINPSALFFSPTAGAGMHTNPTAPNRGSAYLPAGYYDPARSMFGESDSTTALTGRPMSMADFTSDIAPKTEYRRSMVEPSASYRNSRMESPGPSPLISPQLPYGMGNDAGMSSNSLLTRSDGRSPSAYLDDLFDAPPVVPRQS
jgi:hypothetical protein